MSRREIERFADLLGQERAVAQLIESYVRGRIPQAYIFSGPDGVGKRSAAIVLAKLLNCRNPQDSPPEPCLNCPNCRKFNSDNFVDLWVVQPEGQQLKIEQIRELQRIVRFPPTEGGWRIAILQDAERLNPEAANAFLKLLEEPPPKNLFILIVQQPELLLSTIRSRCQRVHFSPIERELIAKFLREEEGLSEEEARFAAALADGSLGRALEIVGEFSLEKRKEWCELIRDALSGRLSATRIVQFAAQFKKDNREELSHFMKIYSSWLRDLLFTKENLYNNIANIDYSEELRALSKRLGAGKIRKLLRLLDSSERALKLYSSPTMTAETLLFYTMEIAGENR